MNGSSTVEGYTRHPWPRDDGIRQGQAIREGERDTLLTTSFRSSVVARRQSIKHGIADGAGSED